MNIDEQENDSPVAPSDPPEGPVLDAAEAKSLADTEPDVQAEYKALKDRPGDGRKADEPG